LTGGEKNRVCTMLTAKTNTTERTTANRVLFDDPASSFSKLFMAVDHNLPDEMDGI